MHKARSTLSIALTIVFVAAMYVPCLSAQDESQPSAKSRHFEFVYSGKIRNLKEGSTVRLWLPVAQDSADQSILQMTSELPAEATETTEKVHGNKMIYVEFTARDGDDVPFRVAYEVVRRENTAIQNSQAESLTEDERIRYMAANRLVPVDGRPVELLNGIELEDDDLKMMRQLYDRVEGHMTYDKSKPGYGNGDVLWACDSQTGNCTDFHSLFISLARHRRIPAHFEIGFPLPPERGEGTIGGYHCWARFYVKEKGWVPVDISEADKHPDMKEYYFGNLTEDRISFSRGRDVVLEPKQDGEPLNYFVYPYVEVDGEVYPRDNIELEFRYADQNNR